MTDDGKWTLDLGPFVDQMNKLLALADEFGVKREGPAGWGFLLAYQLALKYVPGFRLPFNASSAPNICQ